jgi:hypothetical protein
MIRSAHSVDCSRSGSRACIRNASSLFITKVHLEFEGYERLAYVFRVLLAGPHIRSDEERRISKEIKCNWNRGEMKIANILLEGDAGSG